ncbi:hypothetical protein RGQ13_15965 [Thalassotalea psychrophila]|uniref:Lipoprotein n=1 Tax=Thalassotalea psychrophila TaxID=3065647 RepID=A0ABY9TS00_9GAMM|nr:hypothetical protein RGQ13_15965 [Colwelliaceae bacterium SQ149]
MKYIVLSLILTLWACTSSGPPAGHQRAEILNIRDSTIAQIDKVEPDLIQKLRAVSGYAIFSNQKNNKIKLPEGLGVGVIHNNVNGANYYLLADTELVSKPNSRFIVLFLNDAEIQSFITYAKIINDKSLMDLHPRISLNARAIKIYQVNIDGQATLISVESARFWQSDRLN